ncbi:uncharacterized protein BXIN_1230 [Babesia sp. Xinjiang]|uniref:uncharacterized protein n=1 Tax=Babesia sp. Xinjiang TaxID=462227 RepID=UPI000A221849|nr:uncharacterized protein BXIN_1230 [Babesia sp. Xinjiang]ORM40148.1 hypothetical protein BXIN_1230 [Babesia sp. Xinjiang]
MAATAIWKNFRLDNEYRRLMGDSPFVLDSRPNGEGRRVVSATNVFAADAYALPLGTDAKLRELYPSLVELSRESCYMPESRLEKMAAELCKPRYLPTAPTVPRYFPTTEPFVMDSPIPRSRQADLRLSPRLDSSSLRRPDYLRSEYGRERTNIGQATLYQSVDRFPTRAAHVPYSNGNIFDVDTYRTGVFDHGPTGLNHVAFTPLDPIRHDFNFDGEFLSAFKPEGEPGNDYRAIQTPIPDYGTRKGHTNNLDTLVSPFPWEKNMDIHRTNEFTCTPRNRLHDTSEQRYPSYISGRSNQYNGSVAGPFRRFDEPMGIFDSMPPRINTGVVSDFVLRDFARSPLRSLMRDSDHSYGYKHSHMTPRALYHNLI